MHEMTVNELLKLIGVKEEDFEFYYEYLDFIIGNNQLANPLNLDDKVFYHRSREEKDFLKGDEIVCGDYIVYDCCGHDGREDIYSYNSLNEVAQHLISGGGYTNMFTTKIVVIVNGKVKPFIIKGYDKNLNEYTHEKYQNDNFMNDLDRKWVEWLDEEKELSEYEKEIQHDTPLMILRCRYDYFPEDFLEFFQNLGEYDKERFIERLDREVEEIVNITNKFKNDLKK